MVGYASPHQGQSTSVSITRFTNRKKSDRDLQPRRITPEIFQSVEVALLGVKNVHEHIVVVDHHPLAQRVAVHIMRAHSMVFAQLFLDLTGDGLEMRLGGAGANDEEIGE